MMRLAAQYFIHLMEEFPFLEKIAFLVLGLLGLKLMFSYLCNIQNIPVICKNLEGHQGDLFFSTLTILCFALPIFWVIICRKFK